MLVIQFQNKFFCNGAYFVRELGIIISIEKKFE